MKIAALILFLLAFTTGCDAFSRLYDPDRTVVLHETAITLTADQIEFNAKEPLPVLGVDSGVCFIIGHVPRNNESWKQTEAVVKNSIGSLEFDAIPISAEAIGDDGKKYTLSGASYGAGGYSLDKTSQAVRVCKLFCPCSTPPDKVTRVLIKSSRKFHVEKVLWFTTRPIGT